MQRDGLLAKRNATRKKVRQHAKRIGGLQKGQEALKRAVAY